MDTEAIQKWVLEVHEQTTPAEPLAVLDADSPPTAEAGTGLWWAVLNVESSDYEPESMWTDPAEAQRHADGLNAGRYPSWQVVPAAVAWWMRNDSLPEGLAPPLGRGSTVEPPQDMLSAEAVLKAVNRRRAAALANARQSTYDSVRAEGEAQAHALTLVLRDLGLEAEGGKQVELSSAPAGLLEAVGTLAAQVRLNEDVHRIPDHLPMPLVLPARLARALLTAHDAAKGVETTQPASPTWPYVLRFAGQMESMLDCNREKGDRAGWLAAWPRALANDALRNLRELTALLTVSDPADNSDYDHAAIARRAANVANFCMMVADRCGALVLPERLHLFRESNSGETYAARDLEHAKALEAATPGHDADDIPLWVAEPDDKAITVDDDGTKVTKTAAEWANEMKAPGLCFNTLP